MNSDSSFLYKTIIPHIIHHKYDFIFTIGAECTSRVVRSFNHEEIRIPIFFANVDDELKAEFEMHAKDYVTGVCEKNFNNLRVDLLVALKPHVAKVGILYNPAECDGLPAQTQLELSKQLEALNIKTDSIAIQKQEELPAAAEELISRVDTLMLVDDIMTHSALLLLTKICTSHAVTLYAAQLSASAQGAALAFGNLMYPIGLQVGQKVIRHFHDRTPMKEIPITYADGKGYLLVNAQTHKEQGLELTAEQTFLLEHSDTESGPNKQHLVDDKNLS